MNAQPTACLCTVVTPRYLPGVAVMIRSFLQHNGWFDGDVLILHADLAAEDARALHRLDPRVRCRAARPDLIERIDAVVRARPELGPTSRRFLSGEVLTLTDYARVLFCDADLLFQGDVSALFEAEHDVCACPDHAGLQGRGRHPASYAPMAAGVPGALSSPFNAGVMAFRRAALGEPVYRAFLAHLDRFATGELTGDHRDQHIFNLLFQGRCSLLDVRYNFLLAFRDRTEQATGANLVTATVLHFNGPNKPWNPAQSLELVRAEPRARRILEDWSRVYLECLARMKDPDQASPRPGPGA